MADTAFTAIAVQAQNMMVMAQIPDEERFKLWGEGVVTATCLNNLVPVPVYGVTQTWWEHTLNKLPSWAKRLCTLGVAKIVKDEKNG